MRLCDGCGIKVPRFRPRVNQNGQMLCDGCAEGRPGGEGRPIGYHGAKDTGRYCQQCFWSGPESKAAKDDQYPDIPVCPKCGNDLAFQWVKPMFSEGKVAGVDPHNLRCSNCGNEWEEDLGGTLMGPGVVPVQAFSCPECHQTGTVRDLGPKTGSRKHAHDSGDGETIYHCPFCGGGQVTGGSDGSVECGFCHTLFTVQVQPEHAAMPQTINGVPQQVPGMPGEVGGDPNAVAPPVPGGDTGTDAFVPPDAFAPPETPGAPPAVPAVAATRYYINANGVALPEESYMRHLAIAFADDPAAVIEQVKRERNHA